MDCIGTLYYPVAYVVVLDIKFDLVGDAVRQTVITGMLFAANVNDVSNTVSSNMLRIPAGDSGHVFHCTHTSLR
jgi:hypothetical protein